MTSQNPYLNKGDAKFGSSEYLTSSLPLIRFGGLTSHLEALSSPETDDLLKLAGMRRFS